MSSSAVTEEPRGVNRGQATPIFLMTNTLETGGSERQFVTMAHALDGETFSVNAGCLKRIGPFVSEVEGLAEFSPAGSLFGIRSWRARLNLSRFLRGKHIQVAQSFDFYSNLMLIPASRFAGIPAILGSHRQLGDLLTARQFHAQNVAFRLCDRVVCNSRAAADRLHRAGVAARKLCVIPNGLPEAAFATVQPALPLNLGVLRIGMISRMNDPVKRHDMFLRVAAKLAPRFPQLQFVLIGDGPLRPGLERLLQELALGDRVVFLGERHDVPAVLAALDISVLPSASESLSNVILESMAAGVPVVASDVGGSPELVENEKTGLLFSSENEDEFRAALEALLTQPELRRTMGSTARECARLRYSIGAATKRYQDLYEQVLLEKGHPLRSASMVGTFNSAHQDVSR